MEPNQINQSAVDSRPGGDLVFRDTSKKSKGMAIGMILLALLAVGGIGFGVWAMMDGNAQKKQLNLQITDLETQNSELLKQVPDDTETNIGIATDYSNYGPYINDEYFYVPGWGLKFKIPEDLANYGYSVDYDQAQVGYTLPSIGFTAMLKSDVLEGAQGRYYDDIQTCAIVNLTKEPADWNENDINGVIKQFDDYKLLIWNYTRHESCDLKLHIDEVQNKIQEMFSNPEEY